ncbi:MAG: energy transducer TonB [Thiotrichaceae bacterium]|jgi:protein TonB|uniref:TonB family protein n=1 Tax=Candidatus Thiocaldithrix dubininis TaxID=3080823 RepID=A0AA95KHL5_9GAMM|nr:MAG: TonB family protein [Candidatus Thiocaldithrix dubininis]
MRSLPIALQEQPLMATLPLAVLLHALFIFGVSFAPTIRLNLVNPPVLDITLVQTRTEKTPDQVDFMAQANQEASGTAEEKNRPQSPVSSLQAVEVEGESPVQSEQAAPDTTLKLNQQILTTKGETYKIVEKAPEQPEDNPEIPVGELANETQEIAQLLAEVGEAEARYARRPKIHFIDAVSAKSAVEATYIDEWVKKIERIGNINFPEDAIKRNLSGKLILNATLDQQGNVVDAQISLSSGYEVLDKAALRIVKLAAPYPSLPEEIRRKWDQLNITRTWIFHSGTLNTQ